VTVRPVTALPRRLGGKETLPRKRRRYRETPDTAGAARRLIFSVGERVATEDPKDLVYLVALNDELRTAWMTAVAGIRESGFTDREIGAALGMSRQAVEQRWPRVGYRSDPEAGGRAVESG
jgi:hypothetical protein